MSANPRDRPQERWVVTAAMQRAIDERAVGQGVSREELMESAGRSAADWILERLSPRRAVILVGPGGNGGDGLVVGRRLSAADVEIRTLLLQPVDRLGQTSRSMFDRFEDGKGRPSVVEEGSYDAAEDAFAWADLVIDAMFGSGLSRPLGGRHRALVERLNATGTRVLSLDIPSGLPSDCAQPFGEAVRADITLAMHFLKPSHLLFPAASFCGNVAVVSVAYPQPVFDDVEPLARVAERYGIARRLPARPPDGHKGTFGRVLVVAGSIGMTGAAIFACRAALRAGAGLVSLASPSLLDPIFETSLPETITLPVPGASNRVTSFDDPAFEEALERADVLVVGPGLGRHAETAEAVRKMIDRFDGPIVLDADGILAFRGDVDALSSIGGRLLLTPHPGELGALLGCRPDQINADRVETARSFAAEHGLRLLLKGRPTVVAHPDGGVWLNPTGNDGLATGGTGDVLSGLIGGFVAGGASLGEAAVLGAYVHGWTAEIFARDRAGRSLMPSDLIEVLPYALREVEAWR